MREANMIKEALQTGLARLNAERLPAWVTERLANDFTTKAESKLRRVAAREITHKKIARLFAAGRGGKEGSRGETAVSPPGEQGPANEVRQGL